MAINRRYSEVQDYLFSRGLRFRVNDKRYPGKPDIVLPKFKTVVFVNGCFWHYHGCKKSSIPATNSEFWEKKINGNILRDKKNYDELKKMGWKIIIVWECELSKKRKEEILNNLYESIVNL